MSYTESDTDFESDSFYSDTEILIASDIESSTELKPEPDKPDIFSSTESESDFTGFSKTFLVAIRHAPYTKETKLYTEITMTQDEINKFDVVLKSENGKKLNCFSLPYVYELNETEIEDIVFETSTNYADTSVITYILASNGTLLQLRYKNDEPHVKIFYSTNPITEVFQESTEISFTNYIDDRVPHFKLRHNGKHRFYFPLFMDSEHRLLMIVKNKMIKLKHIVEHGKDDYCAYFKHDDNTVYEFPYVGYKRIMDGEDTYPLDDFMNKISTQTITFMKDRNLDYYQKIKFNMNKVKEVNIDDESNNE